MFYLSVIVIILIATVFMVSVGDRLNLPWPVMMTLLGTAALFIPNRPDLTIDSDIILPIFLPPLLSILVPDGIEVTAHGSSRLKTSQGPSTD